ncbi:MAG: type I-C CRISPR-associated protein Cas8c/Csd1 [Desulfobacterales bacterium]|nr:type I-C CRISPR-associated protein Cas8c/Csd1 [Desulfobacterales bacterium]
MSWLAKLYETYENIQKLDQLNHRNLLWPISHFVKNAHIEVVIDNDGSFLKGRTKILHGEDSPTLIPASEESAGRAGSKIAPHPLCEEIGYCSIDRPTANEKKVAAYMNQLNEWATSSWAHPKVAAILKYLEKKTLWNDLSNEIEFPLKIKKLNGSSEKKSAEKAFIRWRVEEPGKVDSSTWKDEDLIQSWIGFDFEKYSKKGFCYIEGKNIRRASNHPRFLRWPGDGAKLVSSNDHSGFTFRGRFTDTKSTINKNGVQAVNVGFEVTQKAHNALRWLLNEERCFRNGDQVYVSWAISGRKTPDPLKSSWDLFNSDLVLQEEAEPEPEHSKDHSIDLGESFARHLKNYLAGYYAELELNEQIVIMGLDSATPGRMGIIYYRELLASEFLERLESWHHQFAWPQRQTRDIPDPDGKKKFFKKTIWPVSSPSPKAIAEAAYGNVLKSNDKLKKNVIERILPCIVDGRQFPRDLMVSAIRRACNRNNCENWEWQRNLGIACALYKGFFLRHPKENERREYSMALEEGRTTREYLYGRLLAIAERIEETALRIGGEERPTTAARSMQRFADRPFSTWRNIELSLQPYMQRLQGNRAGFLENRKKELEGIYAAFLSDDFTSEKPLSGEFLLGYHCQKQIWRKQPDKTSDQ